MKLRLSCFARPATCPAPGPAAHPGYIFAAVLFLCAFGTHSSILHRTAGPGPERDLTPEHREVMEDFKGRVLRHVNPGHFLPALEGHASARHNATVRRRLRDYMRSLQEAEGEDNYADVAQEPKLFVFPSSGSYRNAANRQLLKSRLKKSLFKSFTFPTNVEQPEDPYLDLVMKSAALLMRLRLKNQLQQGKNTSSRTLKLGVYLQRTAPHTNDSLGDEVVQLASNTVRVGKNYKLVQIPLDTQKLAHILDEEESSVLISMTFEEVPKASSRREQQSVTKKSGGRKKAKALSRVEVSRAAIEITAKTRDLSMRRDKRSYATASCEEDKCCMRSVEATLQELNLENWIVYPPTVTLYYCKGRCPTFWRPFNLFSGFHSLLHERKPDLVPEPACAPSGYDDLRLMALDAQKNTAWITYPQVIVTGCLCH